MGEKLDHSNQYDPQYEATWRETRRSLEGSETDLKDYNEREDENHWNMKNIGYEAQQALEKAMKAVLTAHNDGSRFRHDLSRMWDYVETQIAWRPDDVGTAGKTAVRELLDYVTFPDPANPGRTLNWLTAYAEVYRYEVTPKERT